MQGRFLSYSYLLALMILSVYKHPFPLPPSLFQGVLQRLNSQRIIEAGLWLGIILYMVLYPHTPVNSPIHYKNSVLVGDVADERGYYFPTTSLWAYCFQNTESYFPNHINSEAGYKFSQSSIESATRLGVGFFGYWAGTEKIIFDRFAISDPLLARLPVPNDWGWRVGHYPRKFPVGYKMSVVKKIDGIIDPHLNEYYQKIKIITEQDQLFTYERIWTIIAFNLGYYNHLLNNDM